MSTIRTIITLKPGVLDAQGQAVQQGLRALGYDQVSRVRVGRFIEIAVPDDTTAAQIHEMCERFLANPLIEEWRLETEGTGDRAGFAFPRSRELR